MAWLNQVALDLPALDAFLVRLAGSDLAKGVAVMAVIWWLWFAGRDDESPERMRARLLVVAIGSSVATLLGRSLQLVLPQRFRPLHDEALAMRLPYGFEAAGVEGWNSYPSDHAALFVALAVGIATVHRKVGLTLLGYVICFILLPRVFVGLHYPTDLLLGGVIGATCIVGAVFAFERSAQIERLLSLERTRPALFYACFFVFTTQVATLYDGARALAGYAKDVLALFGG